VPSEHINTNFNEKKNSNTLQNLEMIRESGEPSRQDKQADDRHRIMLVEIPKILQDDKLNGTVST
jgi:uncharacterized membrane-anchored protein